MPARMRRKRESVKASALFPVEAFLDVPGVHLFAQPIENALQSPFAVENEVAEQLHKMGPHFLAGRLAARAALAAAGASQVPILRGSEGEPIWPRGFVGSISHTHGLAVAAASASSNYAAMGIDVEKCERTVAPGVKRHVCHPDELAWVDGPTSLPVQNIMALISAKEVIFKAYFPASGVRLGFQDARLHPTEEGFSAEILYPFSSSADLARQMVIRGRVVRDFWVMFGCLPFGIDRNRAIGD